MAEGFFKYDIIVCMSMKYGCYIKSIFLFIYILDAGGRVDNLIEFI